MWLSTTNRLANRRRPAIAIAQHISNPHRSGIAQLPARGISRQAAQQQHRLRVLLLGAAHLPLALRCRPWQAKRKSGPIAGRVDMVLLPCRPLSPFASLVPWPMCMILSVFLYYISMGMCEESKYIHAETSGAITLQNPQSLVPTGRA